MKLILPPLDLTQGTHLCLHIPHEDGSAIGTWENEVLRSASREGKTATVALPAGFRATDQLVPEETCVDWLARTADLSQAESAKIIGGLGVKVNDRLNRNAGTPRSLLGLAAALSKEPEVFIYSTVALDADGYRRVHQCVRSRCSHLCAVHISYCHPRDCPAGARCVDLAWGSSP